MIRALIVLLLSALSALGQTNADGFQRLSQKAVIVTLPAAGANCLGTVQLQSEPATLELANDDVLLRVDGEGRITELTNRRTGRTYLAGPAKAPWKIFYRTGHGYYRPGDALDLEIDPDGQNASVRKEGNALLIEYSALTAHACGGPGKMREVKVGLTIRASLKDDQLAWTATVDNHEEGVEISEIWLPWLYGLNLGSGGIGDVLYWPEGAGRRIESPLEALIREGGPTRSFRITYPWRASMQWFTFNNGEEGLYIGGHDRTLMTTCLNVMANEEGVPSASIVKYPFVRSGETWTSEPVITRLYRGDWHEGSRFYQSWARTWMRRQDPPQWIRRSPGWARPALAPGWVNAGLGVKAQSGRFYGTYADWPTELKDAQALGMNTLFIFGWIKEGFDNHYPDYDVDEQMGGVKGLRDAIAEVQGLGGNVILYTQGHLIDPVTEFYRAQGERIAAKNIWGYPYIEEYANLSQGTFLNNMYDKHFMIACPSAQGWFEKLRSQLEMVAGFGAHGMIFDQMGGCTPYICFDPSHQHARPSLASGPGKIENLRRLREAVQRTNPNFAIVEELLSDCYAGWVDTVHGWGPGFYPSPESFGELFRYTFPEVIATNRNPGWPDKDVRHIKAQYGHAFTLGWRFDTESSDGKDASLGAYLARLCQLRNQHADLLLEGRFVDNEGFLCDNNALSAHGFVAHERLAVTLWNPTNAPQKARVAAPGYLLEEALWQNVGWSGPEHALMPNDVAVLIFKKTSGPSSVTGASRE
jgi:hypothetical protein